MDFLISQEASVHLIHLKFHEMERVTLYPSAVPCEFVHCRESVDILHCGIVRNSMFKPKPDEELFDKTLVDIGQWHVVNSVLLF